VCVGAYCLSGWLAIPLELGFGRMTQGLTYAGHFNGYIVMPLVVNFPFALMAFAAGAAIVWLVESNSPAAWVVFAAVLYGLFGFLNYHWSRPPLLWERVEQTVGALFPALACLLGAMVTGRRSDRPKIEMP
jgi:hypothetical protein